MQCFCTIHSELTKIIFYCMHEFYVLLFAMTNVCCVNFRRRTVLPIAERGGARGSNTSCSAVFVHRLPIE